MKIKIFKNNTDPNKYLLVKDATFNRKNKFDLKRAKAYDEIGYMPKELGEELENLFDSDYAVGIHRVGYCDIDKTLPCIFKSGLINNGDILCGGIQNDYVDINKTVSIMDSFLTMNAELKLAHNYKQSVGCIIIKIPYSYIGMKEGELKPIYYKDEQVIKLLPEYIYGYVPTDREGHLGTIIHNDSYSDIHTYVDSENSLIYESKAILRSKRR